jgi:hypothetical protein
MSVMSMEALDGFVVGTKVFVSGCPTRREYERVEGGWLHNDVVLPPRLFSGLVEAGRVHLVDRSPINRRDVFRDVTRQRFDRVLVVGQVDLDTEEAYAGYFRGSLFYSSGTYPFDQLWTHPWVRVPVAEQEPWMHTVAGACRALAQHAVLHQATVNELHEAKQLLREAQQRLDSRHWRSARITGDFVIERLDG